MYRTYSQFQEEKKKKKRFTLSINHRETPECWKNQKENPTQERASGSLAAAPALQHDDREFKSWCCMKSLNVFISAVALPSDVIFSFLK